MSAPLVSVISPFFNATRWLPGLINVTKVQAMVDFEHILVDDCSTGEGKPLAESLVRADARYKVLQTPQNGGPAAARNLGLEVAKGRYVAFLDADDPWLPSKLEQQVHLMRDYGYAFTYYDYRFISEDGSRLGKQAEAPDRLDVPTLHTRGGVGCLTVMIDRDKLPGFNFPAVSRTLVEDHFAWFTVLRTGVYGTGCLWTYHATASSTAAVLETSLGPQPLCG
ncbi:MAG: glycosyltransferase family 2 protein [Betaproteobacteria bacterium]